MTSVLASTQHQLTTQEPLLLAQTALTFSCRLATSRRILITVPVATPTPSSTAGHHTTAIHSHLQELLSAVTDLEPEQHDIFAIVDDAATSPQGHVAPIKRPVALLEYLNSLLSEDGSYTLPRAATEVVIILRLRGGKGGFKKQLARKGRNYAKAVRQRERAQRIETRAAERHQNKKDGGDDDQGDIRVKSQHGGAQRPNKAQQAALEAQERDAILQQRQQVAQERLRIRTMMATSIGKGFDKLLLLAKKSAATSEPSGSVPKPQ